MSEVHCAFGRPPGPHDNLASFSDPLLLLRPRAPRPAPGAAAGSLTPSVGMAAGETVQQSAVDPGAFGTSGNQAVPLVGSAPRRTETRSPAPEALDTEKPAQAAKPAKASSGTKKRRAASKDKHGHPSGRKSPGHDPKAAADKAKREEYLRKNREAASKCRAKKKDWTQQMDERCRDLATRNQLLRAELDTLSNSVYELKEMVLQHADCGFFPIEGYLQAETKKVQTSIQSRPFTKTSTQSSPPNRASSYAQSGARLSVDDAGGISGYGSMSPPSGTAWAGTGYNDPIGFSSVSTAEGLGSEHGWFGKLQQT